MYSVRTVLIDVNLRVYFATHLGDHAEGSSSIQNCVHGEVVFKAAFECHEVPMKI